jgi:diacylglycerol kinase (ATP)
MQAASVIVGKGRFCGGKYLLAPNATPGEPGFSVVLFDCGGPGITLLYGAALPLHRLGRAPGVRHIRAHRVEFMGNTPVPVQTDGDKAGFTPLTVTDAPGPIQIVVRSRRGAKINFAKPRFVNLSLTLSPDTASATTGDTSR